MKIFPHTCNRKLFSFSFLNRTLFQFTIISDLDDEKKKYIKVIPILTYVFIYSTHHCGKNAVFAWVIRNAVRTFSRFLGLTHGKSSFCHSPRKMLCLNQRNHISFLQCKTD